MKKFLLGILSILFFSTVTHAEIVGQEVSYDSQGETLKGYVAYDDAIEGKRPGVLVVHEWWGHNDYVRRRADMLAKLGYVALAVDMYGDGKTASHPDDAGAFATAVFQNMEGIGKARFLAALELIKQQPMVDSEEIAAIGYCFGGGTVLHMARFGTELDGVVSFHGSLATQHPAQAGTVKAKVLVCHGADDGMIGQEDIDAFKAEMESAGVDYRFMAYPGAVHSFTNPDADKLAKELELPIAYNREADEQSWADMQTFFDEIFK